MGVVLSIADGTSMINESIWDSRFQYTDELNKMGQNYHKEKQLLLKGKVYQFVQQI